MISYYVIGDTLWSTMDILNMVTHIKAQANSQTVWVTKPGLQPKNVFPGCKWHA